MLLQTDYIILRKILFQESSLVVSGLSPDYGRLDFLLKGARGSGSKKFPYAGLFRELVIEFRENSSDSGLFYLRSHEPKNNFDAIANHPELYIKLCEYIQFLLKHTRPMLELPLTYEALATLLRRLSGNSGSEFQLAAAELVFLRESGLVPDVPDGDSGRGAALEKILNYALDPQLPEPDFSPEYISRLIQWVRSLRRYADSL